MSRGVIYYERIGVYIHEIASQDMHHYLIVIVIEKYFI